MAFIGDGKKSASDHNAPGLPRPPKVVNGNVPARLPWLVAASPTCILACPMRVILVGLGVMGVNHLRVLRSLPELCTVAGVVEPNGERHGLAQVGGSCAVYSSVGQAIAEATPDAFVVASPTSTHFLVGREILEAGIPLLLEKPIAQSAAEGRALQELAEKRAVPLMVGHIERFNPAVVAARHIVREGQVGDILNVSARRVGGTPRDIGKAGDVLVDLAVHDIDIATWLVGPPTLRGALGQRNDLGSVNSASMLFQAGGATVDIHVNWVTPVKIREIQVTGTQGYLHVNLITQKIAFTRQNPLLTSSKSNEGFYYDEYVASFATPDRIDVGIRNREPLQEELKAFLKALAAKHEMPVSAAVGVAALDLAEQARRAVEDRISQPGPK
ncbi:MAG: Gfo/Idh/MocA family oxidoreductase [Myxococcales bacterium]|nr:Gfo/Idh/MocA family oxidoreductase [Myxococcales bacterium]